MTATDERIDTAFVTVSAPDLKVVLDSCLPIIKGVLGRPVLEQVQVSIAEDHLVFRCTDGFQALTRYLPHADAHSHEPTIGYMPLVQLKQVLLELPKIGPYTLEVAIRDVGYPNLDTLAPAVEERITFDRKRLVTVLNTLKGHEYVILEPHGKRKVMVIRAGDAANDTQRDHALIMPALTGDTAYGKER